MWKKYDDPRPYSSVGGFIVTPSGKFPILHRSNEVRSVKNCWSLPTGNCEVGKLMTDQLITELHEELGLTAVANPIPIGWYENISQEPDNWWHWIMHIYVLHVHEFTPKNCEPKKHDQIKMITLDDLDAMIKSGEHFAPRHAEFFLGHWSEIKRAIYS